MSAVLKRQVILDTETTGLEASQGHRIIEVGCIELVGRRYTQNNFHRYINPEREIDRGAIEVHGITNESLADKPKFFELAKELWDYLEGAELIIHNAAFDIGFLNAEFGRVGFTRRIDQVCEVTDTVAMARKMHPGQRVSLDALCKRYEVDNSGRDLHGALLDARLLADVYLSMTGGQNRLMLDTGETGGTSRSRFVELLGASTASLPVLPPDEAEQAAHLAKLKKLADKGKCIWASELPAA